MYTEGDAATAAAIEAVREVAAGQRSAAERTSFPYSDLNHPAVAASRTMTIISWNVAGLRGTLKKNPEVLQQLAAVRRRFPISWGMNFTLLMWDSAIEI
jgi:hypothetical protein